MAQRWTLLIGGVVVALAATLALLPLTSGGLSCGSALLPRSSFGTLEPTPVTSPRPVPRRVTTTWPVGPNSAFEQARRRAGVETRPTTTTAAQSLMGSPAEIEERRARAAAGSEARAQRSCSGPVDARRALVLIVAVPGLALAVGGRVLLRQQS